MSSTLGLVANTQAFSAVDGPGSRFVLFMQGCNFDCIACHNPSTIDRCPIDSPDVERMTVGGVIERLLRTAPFVGGITVTGGEPTLQLDFLVDLFTAVKSDPLLGHLTTLVDTNGTLAVAGWERLAPVMDGAMVDLKAATPDLHHHLTRAGNTRVVESIRWLDKQSKLAEVRLLVIEGVTDTPDELEAWAGAIREIDPAMPVRVLGFRHLGTRRPAREWPETSPQTLLAVVEALRHHGLTSVTTDVASMASIQPTSRPA